MAKINKMTDVAAIVGDECMWCVLCKIVNEKEGWVKTTMAHEIINTGCLVLVTTLQKNGISETVTFIPGVTIAGNSNNGNKLLVSTGRKLR